MHHAEADASSPSTHVSAFSDKYVMYAKKLGEGGGGVVYEGVEKDTNLKVAVKVIRKNRLDDEINKKLLVEVDVLRQVSKLGHKYIMGLLDFYEEQYRYVLVLQHVSGGDLFDRIISKEKYTEHDARQLICELCGAVQALQSIHVIHRDIKPENVLMRTVEDDCEILLGDFGLAVITSVPISIENVGTLQYRAPEIFKGDPYGHEVDVWSLGVVLFVLLSGTFPFDDACDLVVCEKIVTGNVQFPPEIWGNMSPESIDLIKHLLVVNPADRYTIPDILEHPWVLKEKEELLSRSLIESFERLKLFDAARKLKSAVAAVRGVIRMHMFKRRRSQSMGDDAQPSSV